MDSSDQTPEIEPRFPPAGSHALRALELLLSGQSLTSLQFQSLTGTWKLAARIDELRHRWGWPVSTQLVPNPERPKAKFIARYSLPSATLSRYASRP